MSYYSRSWDRKKDRSLFPSVVKDIKIDYELFESLLYEQTPSRSYQQDYFAMRMIHLLEEMGAKVEQDKRGNVYATKGVAELYPCAVAHMDINQDVTENMRIVRTDNWMMAFDDDCGTQVGPGFDDKCGVYFCLEMMKQFEVFKVALFVDEEIGCQGSSVCDMSFFKDCTMVLQLDRNSYNGPEFIWHTNGNEVCSSEFINSAEETFLKWGYLPARGVYTDVGELKERGLDCICANIGCGYFDEHSESEVLMVPAFENAVNFAYELLKTYGDRKWKHTLFIPSRYPTKKNKKGKKSSKTGKTGTQTSMPPTGVVDLNDHGKAGGSVAGAHIPEWENGTQYYARGRDTTPEEVIESLDSGYCPICYVDEYHLELNSHNEVVCTNCDAYFDVEAAEERVLFEADQREIEKAEKVIPLVARKDFMDDENEEDNVLSRADSHDFNDWEVRKQVAMDSITNIQLKMKDPLNDWDVLADVPLDPVSTYYARAKAVLQVRNRWSETEVKHGGGKVEDFVV